MDEVRERETWHRVKLLVLSMTCEKKGNSMKNKGRPNRTLDIKTQRATHYHADYVAPVWSTKLDRHIFYISLRAEKTMRADAWVFPPKGWTLPDFPIG